MSVLTPAQVSRIDSLVEVFIPPKPVSYLNFSFSALLSIGTLFFDLIFIDGLWRGTTTLNDEVRTFTLIPNIVIYPLHSTYALLFTSTIDAIGEQDLDAIRVGVVIWK